MWYNDPETLALLRRIVTKTKADASYREELMQEALVHLWLDEQHHPGESRSWYVQSCRFHLGNYLHKGRSLDSPKRRNGKLSLSDDLLPNSEGGHPLEPDSIPDSDGDVLSAVAEHEMLELLAQQLSSQERTILDYLAQDFTVREVA